MRKGEILYKYSIRVLEEALLKEKGYLKMFNDALNARIYKENQRIKDKIEDTPEWINEGIRIREWADKNIDSCSYRINELEETIIAMLYVIEGVDIMKISERTKMSEETIKTHIEQIQNRV